MYIDTFSTSSRESNNRSFSINVLSYVLASEKISSAANISDKFNPEHTGNVQYIYNANGVKLKKTAIDNGNLATVEYNGNFVYENGSLKSITHPEGYIEQEDDGSFTYVYEHRDIWENTRITYADNDGDSKIDYTRNGTDIDGDSDYHEEIRREQNYYPFGMQWEGVNSTIRNAKNNLKTFQGQELTEDLGLNTHEWRYRMSDRSIGRFWQIDPLAEKYVHNSIYAFQENKLGSGVELEGLENSSFEARQRYRDKQHMKGNITTDEFIQQGSSEGNGALAGVSLMIPGPEDIVIGSFLASKFGGAIIRGVTKFFSKSGDEIVDASKGLKNAEQVAEGKKFEATEMQKAIDEGKDVTGHNRLVPENGTGNVNGNRTDTDQLIKNEDGTFKIVETKRTSNTKQSKGQNAAQEHVENGNGVFETRTNQPSQGLKRGDKVKVTDYERINKYNE